MIELAISPLELDSLTRSYYGQWDAYVTAMLAPLSKRKDCYDVKFYKAPASNQELISAFGYASCGLHITRGALIFGFYLPALVSSSFPPPFNLQISDTNLRDPDGNAYQWFDVPVPSIFVGNYKPTYLTADALQSAGLVGSAPALLPCVYPIVGDGPLLFEFWDTLGASVAALGGASQRIELVIGVLEPKQC